MKEIRKYRPAKCAYSDAKCYLKTAWRNENGALRAARDIKRYYGERMHPYRCQFCHKWHIGHR